MRTFIESADIRETSIELMEAILSVACDDEARAEQIWTDGPTESEKVAIIEIVTNNGMYDTDDFCWGAAGSRWASEKAFDA